MSVSIGMSHFTSVQKCIKDNIADLHFYKLTNFGTRCELVCLRFSNVQSMWG